MDMYEEVMQRNLWIEFDGGKGIEFIDYNYKVKVEDEILRNTRINLESVYQKEIQGDKFNFDIFAHTVLNKEKTI